MPINARPEYFKAQGKYLQAKTRIERIKALEEMIRTAPTHKGAEVLRANLKSKLSKLKKQKTQKKSRRITAIAKEGDAQVCIIGLTQSGKSTLLSKLTNAKPKISPHKYTTTKPQVGMIRYKGVLIQTIEVPSKFTPIHMNVAQNCNGIVILYNDKEDLGKIEEILLKFKIKKRNIKVTRDEHFDVIKKKIWKMLDLMRIYTKEPGKKPERKALVLKKGATVRKVARDVHKDFLKFFKFARIWGDSAKFDGMQVGLDHEVKDGDIVEIHIKA